MLGKCIIQKIFGELTAHTEHHVNESRFTAVFPSYDAVKLRMKIIPHRNVRIQCRISDFHRPDPEIRFNFRSVRTVVHHPYPAVCRIEGLPDTFQIDVIIHLDPGIYGADPVQPVPAFLRCSRIIRKRQHGKLQPFRKTKTFPPAFRFPRRCVRTVSFLKSFLHGLHISVFFQFFPDGEIGDLYRIDVSSGKQLFQICRIHAAHGVEFVNMRRNYHRTALLCDFAYFEYAQACSVGIADMIAVNIAAV